MTRAKKKTRPNDLLPTARPAWLPEKRSTIVETVQTPLGFFVLSVLVVEVTLGVLAGLSSGTDRTYAILGMLGIFTVLIAIVAILAFFRPEALRGARPLVATVLVPRHVQNTEVLVVTGHNRQAFVAPMDGESILDPSGKDLMRVDDAVMKRQYGIILVQAHVDYDLVQFGPAPDEHLSAHGLAQIVEYAKAKTVILLSCNSVVVGAELANLTNMVAMTRSVTTEQARRWTKCLFDALAQGQSLSSAFAFARGVTGAPAVLQLKEDVVFESPGATSKLLGEG
jgi:hypothetical protein